MVKTVHFAMYFTQLKKKLGKKQKMTTMFGHLKVESTTIWALMSLNQISSEDPKMSFPCNQLSNLSLEKSSKPSSPSSEVENALHLTVVLRITLKNISVGPKWAQ